MEHWACATIATVYVDVNATSGTGTAYHACVARALSVIIATVFHSTLATFRAGTRAIVVF